MASTNTILSDIGKALKKFFGIAIDVAKKAEPIVDIAFPGIATLYNLTVNAIANAENAAIAAGAQSGTGVQKLAFVISAIEQDYINYAVANGVSIAPGAVEKWANAVVATLNAMSTVTPTTSA